jgi:Uma2 family endonuclease
LTWAFRKNNVIHFVRRYNQLIMVATVESPPINTLADLLDRLGGIPADRVRFRPAPGEATEQDCFDAERRFGVLCELIDGTLVEKAMGLYESVLAGIIIRLLGEFVSARRLGIVGVPDGMYRVKPGQIRMPDVSFTSWERLPADFHKHAAADLSPDLAIEILGPSNTVREMARRRVDLFAGGTRLMWVIDPPSRTVAVYVDAESSPVILHEDQSVDGGPVLPGFSFSIRQLFADAQSPQP